MKRGCLLNLAYVVCLLLLIMFEAYVIIELAKKYPDNIIVISLVVGLAGVIFVILIYKILFGSYVNLKLLSGIKEYDDAYTKGLLKEPASAQIIWNKNQLIIYVQLLTKSVKVSIKHEDIVSIQSSLIEGVSAEKAEHEAVKGAILGSVIGGKYGAFVGAGIGLSTKNPRIKTSLTYKQDGSVKTLNFIYPFEERLKEIFFKKHYKDIYTPAEYL